MPVATVAAEAHRIAIEKAAALPDRLLEGLGCPLVMAEHPGWRGSRHRLLFLGQETARWSVPGAVTLRECIALAAPLEKLASAYVATDFGIAAPRVHFIRAMRRLERELEDGERGAVMWTNACHVDCAPMGRASASVANLPRGLRGAVLEWQRGLLAAEVAHLLPRAVLAACGPKYDDALVADFPGLRFEPVGDSPVREFARLVHPELPDASFRTHHPRTLEITKTAHLARAIELIRAEAGEQPVPR